MQKYMYPSKTYYYQLCSFTDRKLGVILKRETNPFQQWLFDQTKPLKYSDNLLNVLKTKKRITKEKQNKKQKWKNPTFSFKLPMHAYKKIWPMSKLPTHRQMTKLPLKKKSFDPPPLLNFLIDILWLINKPFNKYKLWSLM